MSLQGCCGIVDCSGNEDDAAAGGVGGRWWRAIGGVMGSGFDEVGQGGFEGIVGT